MPVSRSLIAPTANPLLERALRDKLKRRSETTGKLGELEPLAVRLGLVQNSLKPRFRAPQPLLHRLVCPRRLKPRSASRMSSSCWPMILAMAMSAPSAGG